VSTFTLLFILLVAFQLKHFIVDLALKTEYRLRQFEIRANFYRPLFSHCSLHAAATWLISAVTLWGKHGYAGLVAPVAAASTDFVSHLIIGGMRSDVRWLGRFKDPSKKTFWVAASFSQVVHHLTHYVIVWHLVRLGISE
jgi:hypothetical protein